MKKRKWLLTVLAAASVLTCAIGFAACGDDTATPPSQNGDQADAPAQTHTHSWATAWSKDGTSHWYACSSCNEKKDKAPHDFSNGACICGVTPSAGLTLEENANGSVCIKDMGNCTDSEIIVPNVINGKPVTAIAPMAFSENTSLKSIALPASVTSIGSGAFMNCTSLVSVSVADSAAQSASAFAAPFADTEDTEPVSEIGANAFGGCTSLISVEIPYGVTAICEAAFYDCPALKSVLIPDSITEIKLAAFQNCKALETVVIPDSVTEIGWAAFAQCESITDLTISNSVTELGMNTFSYCTSLTSVKIPKSLTEFGVATFGGCTALTNITVDKDNPNFVVQDGVVYNQDKTAIVCLPAGLNKTTFTIPNSVTKIGGGAFLGCDSLENVTIPDSVTEIDVAAFCVCTSLTDITIPNSVTHIGEQAFSGCTSLTSITIPDSVTEIEFYAFEDCALLTSITFEGTREQWEAIKKGNSWDYNTGDYTVHCSDD